MHGGTFITKINLKKNHTPRSIVFILFYFIWDRAVKIMAGELTDRTNQSAAFAALSISYRMGQIIGLPLGGYLAHPERQWPQMFSGSGAWGGFWKSYPFMLPCLVGAAFAFMSVLLGLSCLDEVRSRFFFLIPQSLDLIFFLPFNLIRLLRRALYRKKRSVSPTIMTLKSRRWLLRLSTSVTSPMMTMTMIISIALLRRSPPQLSESIYPFPSPTLT